MSAKVGFTSLSSDVGKYRCDLLNLSDYFATLSFIIYQYPDKRSNIVYSHENVIDVSDIANIQEQSGDRKRPRCGQLQLSRETCDTCIDRHNDRRSRL